tara:strand:- start:110 stop:634 length:525 start_codon:yes stop_codon:yes gene_type:complete
MDILKDLKNDYKNKVNDYLVSLKNDAIYGAMKNIILESGLYEEDKYNDINKLNPENDKDSKIITKEFMDFIPLYLNKILNDKEIQKKLNDFISKNFKKGSDFDNYVQELLVSLGLKGSFNYIHITALMMFLIIIIFLVIIVKIYYFINNDKKIKRKFIKKFLYNKKEKNKKSKK